MTNMYSTILNIAKKLWVNFSPTWKQSKSENAGSAMIDGIHECSNSGGEYSFFQSRQGNCHFL